MRPDLSERVGDRAVEDHLGRVALELKDLIGKRIPVAAGALPLDKVKFPAH